MEYDFSDKAKGFLKNQTSDGSSKFWGDSSVGDKVVASLKNKANKINKKKSISLNKKKQSKLPKIKKEVKKEIKNNKI